MLSWDFRTHSLMTKMIFKNSSSSYSSPNAHGHYAIGPKHNIQNRKPQRMATIKACFITDIAVFCLQSFIRRVLHFLTTERTAVNKNLLPSVCAHSVVITWQAVERMTQSDGSSLRIHLLHWDLFTVPSQMHTDRQQDKTSELAWGLNRKSIIYYKVDLLKKITSPVFLDFPLELTWLLNSPLIWKKSISATVRPEGIMDFSWRPF